ncbi:MAG: M48 family metallopeptidase [Bacteroidia bacterium]|nr:M48 family metallopeptidase [Bacteroidia bacterium]
MKKLFIATLLVTATFQIACLKVPISGRRQLNLLPESTMMSLSLTNYRAFLAKTPALPTSDANVQLVKRVGDKLVVAITTFLQQKKQTDRIKNFKWEFNVVQENTVNAWCMPGGKVVVYTGLLPVTLDEEGLAVVMGHEIAHAIARHGNERMSQQLALQLGGIGLAVALSQKPQEVQNIFLASYGVGSALGSLKYSRTHETEADEMGVVFMAMAGYDPNKSIAFWERMKQSGGAKVPEILSTHPSDETRIKNLKAFMPQAMKYYKKS